MPFARHTGRYLLNLPEPYLVSFMQHGFPAGQLGRRLEAMHELWTNGLGYLVRTLIAGRPGERALRVELDDAAVAVLELVPLRKERTEVEAALTKGDAVIERLGMVIRETVRSTDIPGRWGGEEFLFLCPETDLAGAVSAGESVRAATESAELLIPDAVTVSVGASELEQGESLPELVSRTDEKLYAAEAGGRNRVVA